MSASGLFRSERGGQSGFSLVEILLALFVFSLGVLPILAVFQVNIYTSAQAINQMESHLLGQTAQAIFQYELATPLCRRIVDSVSGSPPDTMAINTTAVFSFNTTAAQGGFGPADAWRGYYVEITSGKGAGLTRRISANTDTTLTVEPEFPAAPEAPDAGSRLKITRHCLPPTVDSGDIGYDTIRAAKAVRLAGDALNEIRGFKLAGAAADASARCKWMNGGAGPNWTNCYLIMLSGRAARKTYKITGMAEDTVDGDKLICAEADFGPDGDNIANGDKFFIAGHRNPVAPEMYVYPIAIPANFGAALASGANPYDMAVRQTGLSPLHIDSANPVYQQNTGDPGRDNIARYGERAKDFPLDATLSCVIIVSDQITYDETWTDNTKWGCTREGRRLDLLIYQNYDEFKTPAQNRPAIAHTILLR